MILSFEKLNPYITLIYFILAIVFVYTIENPVIIFLILASIALINIKLCRNNIKSSIKMYMAMSMMLIIINPIVSHRGATILFYIRYTPITLESIIYGIISAMRLIALLLLGSYFNSVMDYEKINYILMPLGNNLSLIISLSIKFIPEYLEKLKNIKDTQRSKGIVPETKDKKQFVKSLSLILNAFFFITLEEGIVTIKSIKSRGYENRNKKSRKRIKLRTGDYITIFMTFIMVISWVIFKETINYEIYPRIMKINVSLEMIIAGISYIMFMTLPILLKKGGCLYVDYKTKRGELLLRRR